MLIALHDPGTIPTEIGLWSDVTVFNVAYNNLMGTVPSGTFFSVAICQFGYLYDCRISLTTRNVLPLPSLLFLRGWRDDTTVILRVVWQSSGRKVAQ